MPITRGSQRRRIRFLEIPKRHPRPVRRERMKERGCDAHEDCGRAERKAVVARKKEALKPMKASKSVKRCMNIKQKGEGD